LETQDAGVVMDVSDLIRVLVVAALPASGKTEVRRAMAALGRKQCREQFHMGPNVQLDDYPYVEFMRAIDVIAEQFGMEQPFFQAHDRPFRDPWEWITLVEMLNEDYFGLINACNLEHEHPVRELFSRIDRAQMRAGAQRKLRAIPEDVRRAMGKHLQAEAQKVFAGLREQHQIFVANGRENVTIVLEFARGGPHGSQMPVEAPRGTLFSLSRLAGEILEQAAVLNVLVTPEESRRKNLTRAVPPKGQEDNTGVYHGVPMSVMREEYGLEDVSDLIVDNRIRVESGGRVHNLRAGQFDNRVDKTTFLRLPREQWPEAELATIHRELKPVMDLLVAA